MQLDNELTKEMFKSFKELMQKFEDRDSKKDSAPLTDVEKAVISFCLIFGLSVMMAKSASDAVMAAKQ